MTTIVTRAGEGSALTWVEGDANFTNLNNDKMEKSAPVLAGNLDVATYSITTTTTNGNIVIEPNGTGDLHVITDALRIGDLNAEARISTYGTGNLVLTTNEGNDPDPIITIGNGANANITLLPSGTGSIVLDGQSWPQADGTVNQVLTTNGSGTLSWTTPAAGGGSGTVTSVSGTGTVNGLTLTGTVTTTGSLTLGGSLSLVSPPAIGSTTANTGRFTTITSTVITGTAPFTVASTTEVNNLRSEFASKVTTAADTTSTSTYLIFTANADTNNSVLGINGSLTFNASTQLLTTTSLAFKDTREPVFALGTTGGTIAPNCANGSVQSITLNAALTINAFTSPIAGQSLTLIITGGTAYTSITSTMKFAGGIKTLTATAGCIDILTVYYTGAVYYASLGKGFA